MLRQMRSIRYYKNFNKAYWDEKNYNHHLSEYLKESKTHLENILKYGKEIYTDEYIAYMKQEIEDTKDELKFSNNQLKRYKDLRPPIYLG